MRKYLFCFFILSLVVLLFSCSIERESPIAFAPSNLADGVYRQVSNTGDATKYLVVSEKGQKALFYTIEGFSDCYTEEDGAVFAVSPNEENIGDEFIVEFIEKGVSEFRDGFEIIESVFRLTREETGNSIYVRVKPDYKGKGITFDSNLNEYAWNHEELHGTEIHLMKHTGATSKYLHDLWEDNIWTYVGTSLEFFIPSFDITPLTVDKLGPSYIPDGVYRQDTDVNRQYLIVKTIGNTIEQIDIGEGNIVEVSHPLQEVRIEYIGGDPNKLGENIYNKETGVITLPVGYTHRTAKRYLEFVGWTDCADKNATQEAVYGSKESLDSSSYVGFLQINPNYLSATHNGRLDDFSGDWEWVDENLLGLNLSLEQPRDSERFSAQSILGTGGTWRLVSRDTSITIKETIIRGPVYIPEGTYLQENVIDEEGDVVNRQFLIVKNTDETAIVDGVEYPKQEIRIEYFGGVVGDYSYDSDKNTVTLPSGWTHSTDMRSLEFVDWLNLNNPNVTKEAVWGAKKQEMGAYSGYVQLTPFYDRAINSDRIIRSESSWDWNEDDLLGLFLNLDEPLHSTKYTKKSIMSTGGTWCLVSRSTNLEIEKLAEPNYLGPDRLRAGTYVQSNKNVLIVDESTERAMLYLDVDIVDSDSGHFLHKPNTKTHSLRVESAGWVKIYDKYTGKEIWERVLRVIADDSDIAGYIELGAVYEGEHFVKNSEGNFNYEITTELGHYFFFDAPFRDPNFVSDLSTLTNNPSPWMSVVPHIEALKVKDKNGNALNVPVEDLLEFSPDKKTITRYKNDDSVAYIELPAYVEKIGEGAFRSSSLTSIKFPSSLKEIGDEAFAYSSLESVVYPKNVEFGHDVFANTKNLRDVTIEDGVKTIANNAFYRASNLSSVTLPSSLLTLDNGAFRETGLEEIVIPASVEDTGFQAFSGCASLRKVEVSLGVKAIAKYSFSGCKELSDVTLPSSLEIIDDDAFTTCSSLTSIDIPQSVKSLGNRAFSAAGLEKITIESNIKSVGDNCFSGCNNLSSVVIEDGVESLGAGAFSSTAISTITIPESITEIKSSTFKSCLELQEVNLPSTLLSIGDNAFDMNPGNRRNINGEIWPDGSLSSITIPDSVQSIGIDAFKATRITSITIPKSITVIPERAFSYIMELREINFHEGVTEIASGAFRESILSGSITLDIPEGIVKIGDDAFNGATGINILNLPSSLREIGARAFANCYKDRGGVKRYLGKVNFSEGLLSIGSKAFQNCYFLRIEGLPSTLTSIGSYAFQNTILKSSLTIPKGVTSLPQYVFSNATELQEVIVLGELESIGQNAFEKTKVTKLKLSNIPTFESGAFTNSKITSIEISEGMTDVKAYAFKGTPITTLKLPKSVNNIDKDAFYRSSLTKIELYGNGGYARSTTKWGASRATLSYYY